MKVIELVSSPSGNVLLTWIIACNMYTDAACALGPEETVAGALHAELGITTLTAGTSVGVRVSVILPSVSAIFALRASTFDQTVHTVGRHAETAPLVSTTRAAFVPLIVGKVAMIAPRAGLAPEQDSSAVGRVRSATPVRTAPVAQVRSNAGRVNTPVHPARLVPIAHQARYHPVQAFLNVSAARLGSIQEVGNQVAHHAVPEHSLTGARARANNAKLGDIWHQEVRGRVTCVQRGGIRLRAKLRVLYVHLEHPTPTMVNHPAPSARPASFSQTLDAPLVRRAGLERSLVRVLHHVRLAVLAPTKTTTRSANLVTLDATPAQAPRSVKIVNLEPTRLLDPLLVPPALLVNIRTPKHKAHVFHVPPAQLRQAKRP